MIRSLLSLFTLLLLVFTGHLSAQTQLAIFDFDNDDINDWVLSGNVRESTDGTADDPAIDAFWDGRPPIASGSGGNAAVLWGDGSGARMRSPGFLDFTASSELYLTFHQYYRHYEGDVFLNVYQDGGLLAQIQLNPLLGRDVETAPFDTVIVNLTDFNVPNLQIEFEHEEEGYFWLIDDVEFFDGFPTPQTVPDTMGNYLAQQGYPYEIDSARWAYVPYQLVVQFSPTADAAFRDSLRMANGAVLKDSCACDKLELWEIDGSAFADNGPPRRETGGSTNIQSNKLGQGSRGKVDGVDLNYYNGVILQPSPIMPNDTLTTDSLRNLDARVEESIMIAILDTGIDYQHPAVRGFVRTGSDDIETTGEDEDGNCLLNDPIGWNFIADNNNPYDDNSHGTHVAGIIADSLRKFGGDCKYGFIPYKTHDNNGISNLFDVACGTFQAILDGADIINDSWGFFGDSSVILSNAIDSAALENILIVSAAGNDGIDLDTLPQYPACYAADNVITVGATEPNPNEPTGIIPAFFTNFSPKFVDAMANGTEVLSAIPDNRQEKKSGTSMATPMVTAAAAKGICVNLNGGTPEEVPYRLVRTEVLECLTPNNNLRNAADQGRFLRFADLVPCIMTDLDNPTRLPVRLYPNPVVNELWLESPETLSEGRLRIINLNGQTVHQLRTPAIGAGVPYRVDIPDLPSGAYLVQLRSGNRLLNAKIIRY